MKKFLLSFLMMGTASFSMFAATHLVINKGSSGEKSVSFGDLHHISFVEKGLDFMNVANESTLKMPFSQISTIHFASQSSVSQVEAGLTSLKVSLNGSHTALQLTGYAEGCQVAVYSITGSRVIFVPAYFGDVLDISSLTSGVYIVKAGNQVQKFVK